MSTLVTIFFMPELEPFICHVDGEATVEMLQSIEVDVRENELDYFDHGPGEYVFSVSYFSGQYGEYGRCELAPGWELSEEAFRPVEDMPDLSDKR